MKNQLPVKYGVVLILMLLVGLTGCRSNEASAQKIGAVFVERLIYGQEISAFEALFVQSDELEQESTQIESNIRTNFSNVFDPITGPLDKMEKEDVSKALINQLRNTTTYRLEAEMDEEGLLKITYRIRGFDYAEMIGQTMTNILATSDDLRLETVEAKTTVLNAYYDAVSNTGSTESSIDVSIYFEKSDEGWMISEKNESDAIQQLILAFFTGNNDLEDYQTDTMKKVNEMVGSFQND